MNPRRLYLSPTDTAVGFLSADGLLLNRIKGRQEGQPLITVLPSFSLLVREVRVPKAHRKRVRNSRKTTFVYPDGSAFRVAAWSPHRRFLEKCGGGMFSTSANPTGGGYDETWARSRAEVTVEGDLSSPGSPSRMIRLGKKGMKTLRS